MCENGTGVVFDIKEFAVFDGPGIRTTVFLKGCPLRCRWCHNPEGLSPEPELMVSRAACTRCGACEKVCPSPGACTLCGACISQCRGSLRKIAGTRMGAAELADRLKKDADIYSATGGGVTFSGGEPLLQWSFLREVIRRLPGIHTAAETSGYTSDKVFRECMGICGLIMLDWKVSDPALHRAYTGADQLPILRHARMLAKGDTPFILRMPIIPGVNDNREHFRFAARLVEGAKSLLRVDLLPYQRAAGAKYEMVEKNYDPGFDEDKVPCFFPEEFESRGIPFQRF